MSVWMHGTTSLLAVSALVTLSACTPIEQAFHCTGANDCPSGLVCEDARCMPASAAADSCTSDSDCEAATACENVVCEEGKCTRKPVPADQALPSADQLTGDCRVVVCDGRGKRSSRVDDSDAPPRDDNPCRKKVCVAGAVEVHSVNDGQTCNGTGQCQDGECSVCSDGLDCTEPSDCTVHLTRCADGKSSCVPTDRSIDGKVCGAGRVCSSGSCELCEVGAPCEGPTDACQERRVMSCQHGRVCGIEALTGTRCGSDSAGHPLACNAGECMYQCKTGSCVEPEDPCQPSHWSCPDPDTEPKCVKSMAPDGTPCGSDQACRMGTCARAALVNGDFARGLMGWTLTGDATNFLIADDLSNDSRRSLTTWVESQAGGGERALGTASQQFVVPDDALALRFNVFGGHAHVRLRDAKSVLFEVAGLDSNEVHVPVSWDLSTRRGQTLTLSIDDDLSTSGWGFVAVTGFDVIRDVPSPIQNAQLDTGDFSGWDASGDASYFNLFNDYDLGAPPPLTSGVAAYGRRPSVSTFVLAAGAPHIGATAIGTLTQTFVVPMDAVALRFNVHGGSSGIVGLYEQTSLLHSAHGTDDNEHKLPVSWDLTLHRGKTLRLSIIDNLAGAEWDFLGCSGFDVITSYNGP